MLLDPAEEDLDLPAAAVQLGDLKRVQGEVVGEEDQRTLLLGFDVANPTQRFAIALLRIEATKPDRLVAAQPGCPIDKATGVDVEAQVRLGANREERSGIGEAGEPAEVEIGPVHHVNRPWLDWYLVEHVDLVNQPFRRSAKRGNRSSQIQQCVQLGRSLGRSLGRAKVRPGKQAQTKVDDYRIERVDGLLEFQRGRFVGARSARSTAHALRPIGIDPPIPLLVGVGQGAATHSAPKAHLVEQFGTRGKRGLQIAQALSECELREGHRRPLNVTSKVLHARVSIVAIHLAEKSLAVAQAHHLSKYGRSAHPPRLRPKRIRRTPNASHPNRAASSLSSYSYETS